MREEAYPILPIGVVDLLTGANKMFGSMWNCWEEDTGSTNILVKCKATGKMRLVHTCGSGEGYDPGMHMDFIHDQTRQRIGEWQGWSVVTTRPHTKEGLQDLAAIAGKKSLSMSTFK